VHLGAVQLHRWHELPIGQLRQALRLSAHTDEPLDVAVPGRNIRVAYRPVDADTLLRVGFEVQVTPSIDLPAPRDRAPADVTATDPYEWLAGIVVVGILQVVDEDLRPPLVTGAGLRLDRLLLAQLPQVAVAAVREGVCGHVLDVVACWHDWPPSLENERAQ